MNKQIKYKIGASLACANQLELGSEIKLLIEYGIDFLHIDIMDGVFVNNYCFGTKIFDYLKKFKNIEIETHLMVVNPFNKIDIFKDKHIKRLSFHVEALNDPLQTLTKIKEMGMECGIAIDAMTNERKIDHLYDQVDYILVMAVVAGFTGQEFVNSVIGKVRRIREELDKRNMVKDIYVDGHIDPDTISRLSKAGANAFVGGSSGLFQKDINILDSYRILRESLN